MVDTPDAESDGANTADVVDDLAVVDSRSPADAADAADAALDAGPFDAADAASCFYTGPGMSTSSGGGCVVAELYSCSGAPVKLECGCPDAGCTCGTTRLSFACAGGCVIGAAQRQACGLPANGGM